MRWLRHLFGFGAARRRFPPATLAAIRQAIAASEATHRGEIVFAVEEGLPLAALVRGLAPRARAQAVFERLRVWDTEGDTGVLVYVLLADHAIEIVADRGIAARSDEAEWHAACGLMREAFRRGDAGGGALAGIEAITQILRRHVPSDGRIDRDELPSIPVLL